MTHNITVLVRPVHATSGPSEPGPDWPPGFFEQTAGSIQDETFFRHEQGQFEERLVQTIS